MLSCALILGLAAVLAFLAFIGGSSLLARAEDAFGPPAPGLSAFQRTRIGLELGWRAEELLQPADPSATPVTFEIAIGEPTHQIVSRLWFSELVAEGNLFSNYLIYTGRDTQIQAGRFELSAAMSPVEIAAALLDPTPGHVTVSVLPGWRLEEIAASLPSSGIGVSPEEFLLAALSPPAGVRLPEGHPAGSSLEGYLRPGAFEVEREADVIALLNAMLLTFDSAVSADLRAAFEQRGLNLHEALSLASIVEREAVDAAEMPLIASVFLNRLSIGMHLQADPTVQYAVGYDGRGQWWPNPLTAADLQADSPYNTYVYAGLPPGPIAAASLQALQAVAQAPSSPYYYFQAACDGSGKHVFAVSYEEHLGNNCQ